MNHYNSPGFYALLCILILLVPVFWNRFPQNGRHRQSIPPRLMDTVFSACTAIAVGTLFHLYPGNSLHPVGDSAIFVYIGERMLAGKIPYVDLFDHKGPVLFFIQYLGLLLSPGSTNGIWVLEVVNMFFTLLLLTALCREMTPSKSSAYPALLMAFVACGWRVYEGGNFTEEYALPWVSLSMLIFYRFFMSGSFRKRDIPLLGISFLAVFLLRANLAALWIACIPLVLLILLKEKRFRDAGICTGLFCLGILAGVIPIAVYLSRHQALRAFYQCYFDFNMRYAGEVGLDGKMLLHLSGLFARWLLPGIIGLILSLILHPGDRLRWINLWVFAVCLAMAEMSGRDYPHYLIVLLPVLVPGLTDFFTWEEKLLKGKKAGVPGQRIILVSCLAVLAGSLGYHTWTGKTVWPEDNTVTWLKENTDEEDDVLILGNDGWAYLGAGRKTENRYPYQVPPIGVSEEVRRDFLQELERHPSDVVLDLVGEDENEEDWKQDVALLLTRNGYSFENTDGFSVYRRP